MTRYAAIFREGDGPVAAGVLIVDEHRLLLQGRRGGGLLELSLPYATLTSVEVGRKPAQRLNGHPTVVITRQTGAPVQIEPFTAGFLREVADLLAALTADHPTSGEPVIIRAPIKHGRHNQVRALIRSGPPFDPAALGLTRHQVFLTDSEAIFVLEGPHLRETLEHAIHQPRFWHAGLAWTTSLNGPPQLADPGSPLPDNSEPVYTWIAGERTPSF